jgi:hypothetical protein
LLAPRGLWDAFRGQILTVDGPVRGASLRLSPKPYGTRAPALSAP